MESRTYSSKSTAVRGAKRLGIKKPKITQTDDGRWTIQLIKQAPKPIATGAAELPADPQPTFQPLPVLSSGVDLNNPELIVPKRTGITETYEDLEAISPIKSQIKSPIEFIWAFLDLNPAMGRKEAIAILVKHGCNINTARTQYQLYRTSGGTRKKK